MTKEETATEKGKVKIIQVSGVGWTETYQVMPDGTWFLIHSNDDRKHELKDATSMTETKTMSWADFVRRNATSTPPPLK